MAKTLLDLANDMNKLADSIPQAISSYKVKIAQTIVADLAYKTPVDTSQAISNWVVTLGAKNVGIIRPHYPGEYGSTRNASAQETIQRANVVLSKKKPGESIFITNNLPYIVRLNDGYSAQAPAGFVERSILIGRRMAARFQLKKA